MLRAEAAQLADDHTAATGHQSCTIVDVGGGYVARCVTCRRRSRSGVTSSDTLDT